MTRDLKRYYGLALHWINNLAAIASPLFIIPYLLINIGVAEYGRVALVQIVTFATLPLIDFGIGSIGAHYFGEAATKKEGRKIFYASIVAHSMAWLVVSLIGGMFVYHADPEMVFEYSLSQIAAVFSMIPPVYAVVHYGKQAEFGSFGAVAKLGLIPFVVVTVTQPKDIWLFFSYQAAVNGLLAIYLFRVVLKDTIGAAKCPEVFRTSLELLKLGWPQLLRRAASIPIPLGIAALVKSVHGAEGVAIYSVVDKLRTVTWQAIGPVISLYSAVYFRRDEGGESVRLRTISQLKLILFAIALLMSVVPLVFPEVILQILRIEATEERKLAWRIAGVGVFPSICLAYLMAKYLPALQQSRPLTLGLWASTALVLGGSAFSVNLAGGLSYASLAMVIWETLAAVNIFLLTRSKR